MFVRNIIAAEAPTTTAAPTPTRPAPLVVEEPLDPADADAVAAGAWLAMALTPPLMNAVFVSVASLPPMALAAFWNELKVWFPEACALIEPTMPKPQCVTCWQWNQIGWVSSRTVIENCLLSVNPELKPPSKGVHGAEKEDWVTEC